MMLINKTAIITGCNKGIGKVILEIFAEKHGLKMGTIADLIHYRAANESMVERVGAKTVQTSAGPFELVVYRDKPSGAAHLALRNELYDRAINTAELANPRSNFELRFLTPYRFVRALKAGGIKATPTHNPGAVRLLTIHGAKGLEAHTVLMLDTEAQPPKPESMGVLVDWPGEAERPQRFIFLASEKAPPVCAAELLAAEQQARGLEELNALYVALTRAEARIVISSVTPYRSASTPSWRQRIAPQAQPLPVPEPVDAMGDVAEASVCELLELPVCTARPPVPTPVDAGLVERFLAHPYFLRMPPKSLDRNDFSDVLNFVDGLSDADACATLTQDKLKAVYPDLTFTVHQAVAPQLDRFHRDFNANQGRTSSLTKERKHPPVRRPMRCVTWSDCGVKVYCVYTLQSLY